MPRRRRRIISNSCYEFCFRARSSLPLSAHRIIREIIGSSVARAQRDDKVDICHDIWEGSHPHIFSVTHDAAQAKNFLGEVQKKITDAIKRLLGLSYLEIWEGHPSIIRIKDIASAKQRIAYLYSNPAQDDLVDSIDKFPGYSSWREFHKCLDRLDAVTIEKFRWIRLPTIPSVSPHISAHDDERLVRLVRSKNKKFHDLKRSPNAWMKCFGITTDAEAAEINTSIIAMIRENEQNQRLRRSVEGKTVLGASRLLAQPLMAPHVPKKKERKIHFIASDPETRKAEIADFNDFCRKCDEGYQCNKRGDFSFEWPPGAFRPPIPPLNNVLPEHYY